jgi:hypothetical protein
MKYVIRPLLPEIKQEQQINEAEYKEITDARKLAWDILLVKEFFSYITRNFYELENKIQTIETEANNNQVNFKEAFINGSFCRENTHILNVLVMNLLTTCRSYLELFDYRNKLNKERDIFEGRDDIRNILQNIKETYHDQDIMCVFFKELRDYAQHHSRPIKGSPTTINNQKIKIGFVVDVNKIFKKLEARQKSKTTQELTTTQKLKNYLEQSLLEFNHYQQDLQNYPKSLNIRLLIKEYILLMYKINEKFNEELDAKFQKTKKILSQKVLYYCNNYSSESSFEIFKQNEETQELEERFDVCLQLINDWEIIVKKYSDLDLITD